MKTVRLLTAVMAVTFMMNLCVSSGWTHVPCQSEERAKNKAYTTWTEKNRIAQTKWKAYYAEVIRQGLQNKTPSVAETIKNTEKINKQVVRRLSGGCQQPYRCMEQLHR